MLRLPLLALVLAGCASHTAPPARTAPPTEDPACAGLRLQAGMLVEAQLLAETGLDVGDVDPERARALSHEYALLCR